MRIGLLRKMLAFSLLLGSNFAYAADAEDFRTQEYLNSDYYSKAYDAVRLAEAYAKGYSGAGVTVGVVDYPINFSHPEFASKKFSAMFGTLDEAIDWGFLYHGTAVAGVLAVAKNNRGMHGVAYDAEIMGSNIIGTLNANGSFKTNYAAFDYYLQHPEIKIINNSYGEFANVFSFPGDALVEGIKEVYMNYILMQHAATANGKLLVYASGNDGHTTPLLDSILPVFDYVFYGGSKNNTITVIALDQEYLNINEAGSLKKDEAGNVVLSANSLAGFSDLAMFAEDYTLVAPGVDLYVPVAEYENLGSYFYYDSGTSCSAPIVSGVGALVQQAYPYLSGKQLGDVLLSTANNKLVAGDGYFVTREYDYATGDYSVNVFVVDSTKFPANPTEAKIREIANASYWVSMVDWDTYKIYYDVPMEAIFGQGLVDAAKAVDGLGAINVRRLTKEDISSDYTVVGSNAKTAQALYSVDTQGYDSVWRNDISEIRAGYISETPLGENYTYDFDDTDSDIEDLANRYKYYDTNWLQYLEGGTDDETIVRQSEITQQMVDYYNQYVDEQGILGLHGGLYKAGEGVLVLAGENTYQGSTVAAGGTLQIDGSVAGDAYSEEAGTIAGAGTINGNLYNNGTVQAGQVWSSYTDAQAGDTLTVAGNLSGNGTLIINLSSTDAGTMTANLITVAGTAGADISHMSVQAGTSAAPDATVSFLTAADGVNISAETVKFSGLLNAEVSTNAEKTEAYLTTTAANNTGVHDATAAALSGLYSSLSLTEQQEMYSLYALNKADATTALTQLSGGLAENMAHDAMQNRDVRTALREQEHLQRDEGLWMLLDKHWQRYDNTDGHGFTTTIGKDFFNNDSAYAGALFAYSTNSLSDKYDKGDYDNYALGLYGGTKNAAGTWRGYVSYGLQDNSVNRNLTSVGKAARADYDSSTIGAGVRYAYDLQYGNEAKASHWHSVPYAQLNYTHYQQDGYTEKGAGIYERQVAGYSDNYADGELGLEIKRTDAYGSYGFSLGYRRILTGEQQSSTAFFTGDGSRTSFTSAGTAEEKDHVVLGAFIGTQFSEKWSAAGQLQQDWSGNSKEFHVNLVVNYSF